MEGFEVLTFSMPGDVFSAISGVAGKSEELSVANVPTKEEEAESWFKWGTDNLLGIKYRDLIESNPVLSRGILTLSQVLASGGLVYGKFDAEKQTEVRTLNPELEEWLDSFDANNLVNEVAYELASYNMAFVRVILTKDRKKIARLFVDETLNVRYLKPKDYQKGLDATHVAIYGSWDKKPSETGYLKLPLLDPYNPLAEQFAAHATETNFIYPIKGQNSGRKYYAVPHWYSASQAEWLSISSSIANFKKALMKNMAVIKQQIEIDIDYWKMAVPDWDNLSAEKKKEHTDKRLKEISDFLSGEENAGKAFVSYVKSNQNGDKVGINFKELSHKLLDGTFIEDSAEANTHILFALGVDATVIGTIPGKGQGAGSGSDKREAFNIMVSTNAGMQRSITKMISKCAKFNGYEERFWIANQYLQTLDKVTPSKRLTQ